MAWTRIARSVRCPKGREPLKVRLLATGGDTRAYGSSTRIARVDAKGMPTIINAADEVVG